MFDHVVGELGGGEASEMEIRTESGGVVCGQVVMVKVEVIQPLTEPAMQTATPFGLTAGLEC